MSISKKIGSLLVASFAVVGAAACSEDVEEEAVATAAEQALSPKNPCFGYEAYVEGRSDLGTGGYWDVQLLNHCDSWQLVRVDIASFPDTDCVWVGPNSSRWVRSDFFHWDPPHIRGVVSC